ncbi:MAG: ABC transporter substrate-binding protein [Dehalococcoidia bacterium]|nr:ABC transporter substrate-binding protein [Dehalococcoidia bacterium]
MIKSRNSILIMVVSIVVMAVMLISCAGSAATTSTAPATTDQKPEKINMVYIADFSGPYSASVGPGRYGLQDATEYLNTKLGGINGVPMEIIFADTEGKVENTVPAYTRSLEATPKPIFYLGLDSAAGATLHDRLIEDDVLGSSTADSSVYPYGNTFGTWPLYCDQMGFVLDWIAAKWKAEGKSGKPKLAIFGWDIAYGHAYWTPTVKAYAEKLGIEAVGEYWYPTSQMDLTPLVAKATEANPDFTFCGATSIGTVVWGKGIAASPLKNKINIGGNGFEFGTYKIAKDAFEGFYGVHNIAQYPEIDNPGVKVIRSYCEKREAKLTSGFTMTMWYGILDIKDGLEKSIDKYGWEKGLQAKQIREIYLSRPEYKIELEGGLLTYGGGMSETRMSPVKLRMFQAHAEGPGGEGFYPVSEWGDAPDMVSENMKKTGKN